MEIISVVCSAGSFLLAIPFSKLHTGWTNDDLEDATDCLRKSLCVLEKPGEIIDPQEARVLMRRYLAAKQALAIAQSGDIQKTAKSWKHFRVKEKTAKDLVRMTRQLHGDVLSASEVFKERIALVRMRMDANGQSVVSVVESLPGRASAEQQAPSNPFTDPSEPVEVELSVLRYDEIPEGGPSDG